MRRALTAMGAARALRATLLAAPSFPRLYATTPTRCQRATLNEAALLGRSTQRPASDSPELQAVAAYTHAFAEAEGRRPRILLCTFEDCSRGRPDDKLAIMLANIGFDVDIGPPSQSAAHIARQAIEADVHGLHVSVLTRAGAAPLPQLVQQLKQSGAEDVFVTAGSDLPPEEGVPKGVRSVRQGDFQGTAKAIMELLQASSESPPCP